MRSLILGCLVILAACAAQGNDAKLMVPPPKYSACKVQAFPTKGLSPQQAVQDAEMKQRDCDFDIDLKYIKIEAARRAQQEVAERSSDNVCRQQDIAGEAIVASNVTLVLSDDYVVDIEHVITTQFIPRNIVACHGTFVMKSGLKFSTAFSIRKNIAGSFIYSWAPGGKLLQTAMSWW